MRLPRWVSTLGLGLVGAGLASALTSLVSAAWLFERYRPSEPWGDLVSVGAADTSSTWSDVHGLSLLALPVLIGLVVVVGPAAVAEEGRGAHRSVVVGFVALLGLAAAVAGALSAPLVAWNRLALDGVQVGSDLAGWRAAFDDQVRWILVDGSIIPPGDYAVIVAVHVMAPIVAAGALVVVGLALRRTRRSESVALADTTR